jgi:hypothetical protein
MSDYSRGVAPAVRAELDFDAWLRDPLYVESDFALARFAGNAAAAIFSGERDRVQDLLEWKSFGTPKKETKPLKLEIMELKPEDTPVTFMVVRELMDLSAPAITPPDLAPVT